MPYAIKDKLSWSLRSGLAGRKTVTGATRPDGSEGRKRMKKNVTTRLAKPMQPAYHPDREQGLSVRL